MRQNPIIWRKRARQPSTKVLGLRLGFLVTVILALAMIPARGPVAAETIVLKVGTICEYVLEGTPGTGAAWSFAEDQSEGAALVKVEDLGYGEPSGDAVGGPAPYRFRLKALDPGAARLVFVYKRSWETDVWNTQTLRMTIRPD